MSTITQLKYFSGEQLRCAKTKEMLYISEGVIEHLNTALLLKLNQVSFKQLPDSYRNSPFYAHINCADAVIKAEYKGERDKPSTHHDWVLHITY